MKGKLTGLSPRSLVANRLLALSEQVSNVSTKETLRQLEKIILEGPNIKEGQAGFQELDTMLSDASLVLVALNPSQQNEYLARLRQRLLNWQHGIDERKKPSMSIFDVFSKDKRERKRKDKLIDELKSNVFNLEQRHEILSVDILALEAKRDEQVQLATKEAPGSPVYSMVKGRHKVLTAQLKTKQFEAQAVARVLETNQTYLSSLLEERDLSGLGGLMPVSMEKMEKDLEQSNARIEAEVDKLRLGTDILDDIKSEKDRIYASLDEGEAESDFDHAVFGHVEKQQVMELFQPAHEPIIAEETASTTAIDSQEEQGHV